MSSSLQDQLDTLANQFPGQVAFYARHLHTGNQIRRNPDQMLSTMSAGKVFILLAYADAVAHQQIDPASRIIMHQEDMLPGTGALRYCAAGLEVAVADLAALMITHSDNTATNLLLRALGGTEVINTCLDRIGVHDAHCVSPLFQGGFSISSPRALAEVYAILCDPESAAYSPDAAQNARQLLSSSQDMEGMSRHLPWSPFASDFGIELPLTVYSKSGQFPGTQVEAGLFVTQQGVYAAAAMCTDVQDPRTNSAAPGSEFLAEFGRLLYEAWSS